MTTEAYGQNPAPDEPLTLDVAIEEFDKTNGGFLEACEGYKENPVTESIEVIQQAAQEVVKTFVISLKSVLDANDLGDEAKANILATLLKGAGDRRVGFLEQLFDQPHTLVHIREQEAVAEDLLKKLRDPELEIAALLEDLALNFTRDVARDVNKFISETNNLLAETEEPEPQEELQQTTPSKPAEYYQAQTRKQRMGKNVLNVTMIAAGVWLGIQLSRISAKK